MGSCWGAGCCGEDYCGCVNDSAQCVEAGISSGVGEGGVPHSRLCTLFASSGDAAAWVNLPLGRSVLSGLDGLKALIRGETLEVGDSRFEKFLLSAKETGVGVGHKTPYLTVAYLDVWGRGKE